MRSDRPSPRRVPAGEGPGRPDRVREAAVPQPASALRSPAAASPCSARRASQPHLPALLHAAGGQDAHWDADPRHAAIRELHQLALRPGAVKHPHPGSFLSETDWDQMGGRTQRFIMQITYKYNLNVMNTNWEPVCECGGQFFSHLPWLSLVVVKKKTTKAAFRETKKHTSVFIFAALSFLWPPSALSLSHSGQNKQNEKQGFNWNADSNMRPCACTTSSHITPYVTQFETQALCVLRLCFVFESKWSHSSATFLQAELYTYIVTAGTYCTGCVMFDMWGWNIRLCYQMYLWRFAKYRH